MLTTVYFHTHTHTHDIRELFGTFLQQISIDIWYAAHDLSNKSG